MEARFRTFSSYLKSIFGERVYRVTVDAGFTCPNRDGIKGTEGCIYCYAGSEYDPSKRTLSVREQISIGIERIGRRYKAKKFLVYFQAFTNTYAPVERLKSIYDEIKNFPEVVGLIVGTRPDAVSKEILELINSYTDNYLVWIEYGLESPHFKSLQWMKRGHGFSDFLNAYLMTKKYEKIKVCSHVILGIPGETREEMLETADILGALKVNGVKIHPLHIIKNTPLAGLYEKSPFPLLSEEEYVDLVIDFIERLHPDTVVQRITGEAPSELLIAPCYCDKREKNRLIQRIRNRFVERDTYQGRAFRF
ncbi:TIGR01212 family radical SAM protein [Desulfurobacterium sp. TC5-1]|uniref:TIGR01212 family radical SAM protein n=1 Tax=Desulfurobacterium sp. TC5-1 TaxID=1158318 RepID=UPI0003B50765|nr:TIGR01212 family radical SAM protein [Desulfurobacterium sp. TC5-1]